MLAERLAVRSPPTAWQHLRYREAIHYARRVQTRYLILAALLTGLAILAAAAIWFSGL